VLIIVVLGVLCMAFLSLFWLTPWGVPTLKRLGGGQVSPDLSFGYRPSDAYRLLDRYGAQGVSHWRRLLLLDMAFPALYAAFLALLATKWSQMADAGLVWETAAIACPILAGLSDYAENILWLRILGALPERSDEAVAAASLFTRAKFIFFGATVAIPLLHIAVGRAV
jgi:hypothetical protein